MLQIFILFLTAFVLPNNVNAREYNGDNYSDTLFEQKQYFDKIRSIKVTKNYDAFEDKFSCSITGPRGINLSSENLYVIEIGGAENGSKKYKLDKGPIQVIPYNGAEIPYWEWTKYQELHIRYQSGSGYTSDTKHDLALLSKAVLVHRKCLLDYVDGDPIAKNIQQNQNNTSDNTTSKDEEFLKRPEISSNLPDILSAAQTASVKTTLLCREKLEGAFSDDVKKNFLNSLGISLNELSDPLVTLLAVKFQEFISDDCRSIDKEQIGKIVLEISNSYNLSFNQEKKKEIKMTLEEFYTAAGIFAFNQCSLEKGFFKTKKEYTDAIGIEFNDAGIPLRYGLNPNLILASQEIKSLINDQCEEIIAPDKRVVEIIMKYFKDH